MIAARVVLIFIALTTVGDAAAELTYVVRGVGDPYKANILAHADTIQLGGQVRLSERDFDRVIEKAEQNALEALRPYGYYAPEITGRITRDRQGEPVLELVVALGAPVVVSNLVLEINGEGKELGRLKTWELEWPLGTGAVLDQTVWEDSKQEAVEIVRAQGYLAANFELHKIEIDLETNSAALHLVFDTGPRYYMGDIDFGEHVLRPGILEYVSRFSKGDGYTSKRMDDFRLDLWKTGYFTDIEVDEIVNHDKTPPTVDLRVTTKTETRNKYQGALGFGTDTGLRVQANWSRHPMSERGDRVDVGVGWKETDDEWSFRSLYRLPRRERARQYWTAELILKFENQDLEFKRSDEDEEFIKVANGNVKEGNLRLGRLKVYNRKEGDQQLFATPFVQFLNSDRRFTLVDELQGLPDQINDPEFDRIFNRVDNALSIGVDLDLISVYGKGWETSGHRERAWAFLANDALGSDLNFAQLYLSTRRSYLYGNRFKFLVRAEVGYTDAKVNEFVFDINGEPLALSITRLPNFYRFKAGGSQSVRGYGFEQLSNNNVGSNHLVTASAEVEFRFLESWSGALFFDIGNAFNDWSDPDLKKGVGVGLRWYSIAGPIRIDVAQALDFRDKPWRLHFTIGTPLL